MSLEKQFHEVHRQLSKISDAWEKRAEGVEREKYMVFLKEFLSLTESLREELIVLRLSNKPTNAKAVRLLAKLIRLRENYWLVEPSVIRTATWRPRDSFGLFVANRVRQRKDGYPEVTGELVSLKEIYKCYKRWCDVECFRRAEEKEIEQRCEGTFGDSQGKRIYHHIRVFLEEEDVEEFDKQHNQISDE